MADKMFDVGGDQLRGAFKWQRDPTDVENYPMSPELAYPEDKAKQKRYLDYLIRLMQDENQFKAIAGAWGGIEDPKSVQGSAAAHDAYLLDTTNQAAWARKGRSDF
jgi:hypothetical protein